MSGSFVVDRGVGFFLSAMNVEILKKLDSFVAHVDVKRLVSDNELDGESKYLPFHVIGSHRFGLALLSTARSCSCLQ